MNKTTPDQIDLACRELAETLKAKIKLELEEEKVVRSRPKVQNDIKLAMNKIRDLQEN